MVVRLVVSMSIVDDDLGGLSNNGTNDGMRPSFVWSAKSKKSHIFIVKLYFHCYAHIYITSVKFQLLIPIIFTLQLYIFIAT